MKWAHLAFLASPICDVRYEVQVTGGVRLQCNHRSSKIFVVSQIHILTYELSIIHFVAPSSDGYGMAAPMSASFLGSSG